MSRNDHVALVTLFERARLKKELDGTAQSHLDGCDICRDRLSWMETATGLGAHELLYDPPQSVMDSVLRLGRNSSRIKQLRIAVVAFLTFDSFKEPALAGVRRTEAASRQMTFEAGDVEIGVSLQRSAGQILTLSGQVLGKSSGPIQDPTAHVDLVVKGDHIQTASLSPWGEFVFSDLPNSQYDLQIYILDRILQIRSLPLMNEAERT